MSVREGRLTTDRGVLAYELAGRGDCVVLCHALATDRRLWEGQVAALSQSYQTLSFDLPGHGQSAAADDDDYSFESMAGDVIGLMDHVGVEKASVLGISVGGEIAQVLAARHPARVSNLLLSSTACYTPEGRASLWTTRMAAAEADGMASIAASSVLRWFSRDFERRRPDVIETWRQRIGATATRAYVGIARTIQSMDLRSTISNISCKTHILCGSDDENTGPPVAASLAALIPDATLDVIQGVGHFPNIEAPGEFNRWLRSRLPRDGA